MSAALFLFGMVTLIPLFATLICGPRHGGVWLTISLASGLALGLLGRAGLITDRLSPSIRLFSDHVVLISFTLVLFAVGRVAAEGAERINRIVRDLGASLRPANDSVTRVLITESLHAAIELAEPRTAHRAPSPVPGRARAMPRSLW